MNLISFGGIESFDVKMNEVQKKRVRIFTNIMYFKPGGMFNKYGT